METIKELLDEIERLENRAYMLMLRKFPVGTPVEYYQGGILMKVVVMSHAKNKCSLRVRKPGPQWGRVYWISAVMCEEENSIEVRTIPSGSRACKIRIRKEKEEEDARRAAES